MPLLQPGRPCIYDLLTEMHVEMLYEVFSKSPQKRRGLACLPFLPSTAWSSDMMTGDQAATFCNEDEGCV